MVSKQYALQEAHLRKINVNDDRSNQWMRLMSSKSGFGFMKYKNTQARFLIASSYFITVRILHQFEIISGRDFQNCDASLGP